MKKMIAFILAAMLVCFAVSALAVSGPSKEELTPIKFEHHKNGIGLGLGLCPVYSAPYNDAYRANNGKASCDTTAYVDIGGFERGWLFVRYETNKGSWRVGWIPSKYVHDVKTSMTPHFTYTKQEAEDVIDVSDNNLTEYDERSIFATLYPGDEYYVLTYYDYYGYE